jgi:hypothetical protein
LAKPFETLEKNETLCYLFFLISESKENLGMRRARLVNFNPAKIDFKLNDTVEYEINGVLYSGEISRVKYTGENRGIRIEPFYNFIPQQVSFEGFQVTEIFVPSSRLHFVRLIDRKD